MISTGVALCHNLGNCGRTPTGAARAARQGGDSILPTLGNRNAVEAAGSRAA